MALKMKEPVTGKTAVETFKEELLNHLKHTVGKNPVTTTHRDWYHIVAHAIRDRLVDSWLHTLDASYQEDAKRVYYLSLEFLIGRSLINNLMCTGLYDICRQALKELEDELKPDLTLVGGLDLEKIAEMEDEAGLGNGGLGRLAACIVDSMATVGIPGYGYGIRYDFGMFYQDIEHGEQVELPDNWLRYGNSWEFPRPEFSYPVKYYGHVVEARDTKGRLVSHWVDTEEVLAMAYDHPVPGYGAKTVNHIRLWSGVPSRPFDLKRFNRGDYIDAVRNTSEAKSLSRVLYPDDTTYSGKALRLKQEYFFVSASLQDIVRRYKSKHDTFAEFPEKVSIQLNDTHPAVAVAELMRLFIDVYGMDWDPAWEITTKTFSYTNHTLLPEALETWPIHLFQTMLPRLLQVILEINFRFLQDVMHKYPGDVDLVRRVSLIDEDGERRVRMAHLAFIGSHKVNGVAAIHTELMKQGVFAEFHRMFPDRIVNKTNGITPRRWLNQANRGLSGLITSRIGDGWITDLNQLRKLEPFATDPEFQEQFRAIKRDNKIRLAKFVGDTFGGPLDIDSLFDVHVKRIHEYKRQLLNVLHVVTRYNRIRANPSADILPRTVLFGGKAAPGYAIAKLIIRLINAVADVINHDPVAKGKLKVLFHPNYNVSAAEIIMPAANLSEQISTAGTEASGTGNMKLALNGALTIGTRDGANIEICEEVGEDNIFYFGLSAEEVATLRSSGRYDPWQHYHGNPELRQALDMIAGGFFSPDMPDRFRRLVDSITSYGDFYLLLADYASYIACQERVDALYRDTEAWTAKAILNVARVGKFSSDRTVRDYAREIWAVPSLKDAAS